MFAFQDTHGPVEIAFTDRHGGVSGGPFASLDLGTSAESSADLVAANLDRVSTAFSRGRPLRGLVGMHQVHGADVHLVDECTVDAPGEPVADALVTALSDVVLMVRVADCVPVLLADAEAGVVGAAHAGRAGLVGGVVARAVEAMRVLGATDVRAWLGPHVCGGCYEVPRSLQVEVAAAVPETLAETTWGTPSLDLGAGVGAQLRRAGAQVLVAVPSRCTREDADLYSYRRDGARSGRLAGLVGRFS